MKKNISAFFLKAQCKLKNIYEQKVIQKNTTGQLLRKVRRFYLGNFKKAYIQQNIAQNRQGNCHRCGACCELIFKCPFLGKDANQLSYCRIYGNLRPTNCHNYPFDRIDHEIERCGYSFPTS